MKAFFANKITVIVLSVILVLAAVGTTLGIVLSQNKNNESDKLSVYTSFYPLYDFTRKIGGDKVEVTNLLNSSDAHHFEPSASQMAGMYEADLIIINGASMESWLEELDETLTNKIVDTSVGVTLLERGEEEEEEEEEHDHGDHDPHIWLSMTNAKIQLNNVTEALITADPDNASYYQDNYNSYIILFEGLQNQYETLLSSVSTTSFVVTHAAFGYIANEYGLTQIALSGIEAEDEPDAATLAEVLDYIEDNNITVVFYQSDLSAEFLEAVGDDVTITSLYTITYLTPSDIANGYDYLYYMAQNLSHLLSALA